MCLQHKALTESQSGWGWKGPLEVVWSNLPAQAGPPRASRPGPCPDDFWTSLRMETPQPPWETWYQCSVTLTVKKCFLMFRGNLLCFSVCPSPLGIRNKGSNRPHLTALYYCLLVRRAARKTQQESCKTWKTLCSLCCGQLDWPLWLMHFAWVELAEVRTCICALSWLLRTSQLFSAVTSLVLYVCLSPTWREHHLISECRTATLLLPWTHKPWTEQDLKSCNQQLEFSCLGRQPSNKWHPPHDTPKRIIFFLQSRWAFVVSCDALSEVGLFSGYATEKLSWDHIVLIIFYT